MNPFQMLQMSRNPQIMMQTMVKSNPAYKQAMDYINANGGNPKDAFYKLAQEKGVDPDEFLRSLK